MGQRYNGPIGGGPIRADNAVQAAAYAPFTNARAIKECINQQLQSPKSDLFSLCAEGFANLTHQEGERDKNKTTQIRRFFEELVSWDERCSDKTPEEFSEILPFIHLLRSKVAYSRGRKLVTGGFEEVLSYLIQKIHSPKTLHNARLFMEATIGFRRALEKN